MTRKRLDLSDKTLKNHEPVDVDAYIDAVSQQLGVNMPITVDSDGLPIVDTDDIPNGVKESSVEKALANNHPRLQS